MKKQAVFVRIPGYERLPSSEIDHLTTSIKSILDGYFPDKEIVVMFSDKEIHFMDESEIRDMIDTLQNLVK